MSILSCVLPEQFGGLVQLLVFLYGHRSMMTTSFSAHQTWCAAQRLLQRHYLSFLDGTMQKMGESAFRSPILARRSESFSTWKNLLKAFASCFNTTSRIEEIAAEVERVVQSGHLLQSDAQKLRGRLRFAEAQLYGRMQLAAKDQSWMRIMLLCLDCL